MEGNERNAWWLRVLLVEDDPDTADAMAALLRLHGLAVQIARTGAAAIEAALDDPPDVALLDLGLPDMHGCELARRLRGLETEKPPLMIALTGYGDDAARQGAEQVGIHLYLLKPVCPGLLLNVLARVQQTLVPGPEQGVA